VWFRLGNWSRYRLKKLVGGRQSRGGGDNGSGHPTPLRMRRAIRPLPDRKRHRDIHRCATAEPEAAVIGRPTMQTAATVKVI